MDPQELDFSGKASLASKIPRGIRLVTWARTIRWFGWGFGETLLPIFILSFSASLTEAGLISSAYDVMFLLSVPLVGFVADAVSARTLLIIGLLLYPFIGLSFYLAGATGIVLFIILARAINGVSYCLDTIGVDTYIRRLAPRGAVASAFGYAASWANFGWLLSALAGAYLVRTIPINELLFLITPFSLIALIPLFASPADRPQTKRVNLRALLSPLSAFLKEVAAMRRGLKGVVLLVFVLDVASVIATFFIPIDAYRGGASLSAVALLIVVSSLPSLSEFWLAEFIDGSKVKRGWSLACALAALPVLFAAAGLASGFGARVLVALGIEAAAIFGSLALQSYATMLSRRDRYGEISSMLVGASTLGDLAGPVAVGLLADAVGFPFMFGLCAAAFAFIAVYFLRYPIEPR